MKKYINVAVITFGFFLLFIVAELIYTLNNPIRLTYYFYEIAKFQNDRGKTDKSINTLKKGANIITYLNGKKYPEDKSLKPLEFKGVENLNLKTEISKYIKNLKYNELYLEGKYDFARIFYDFALISEKYGDKEITVKFLETAKSIDPVLSHWHVELANYYYLAGNKEGAGKTLENCSKYDAAALHCQEYKNYLTESDLPNSLGFLNEEVEKIFDYPSIIKQKSD